MRHHLSSYMFCIAGLLLRWQRYPWWIFSWPDTSVRPPHLRRCRERPEQAVLRRSVRGALQPQRLPHEGHLLRVPRVDGLRSGAGPLRWRARDGLPHGHSLLRNKLQRGDLGQRGGRRGGDAGEVWGDQPGWYQGNESALPGCRRRQNVQHVEQVSQTARCPGMTRVFVVQVRILLRLLHAHRVPLLALQPGVQDASQLLRQAVSIRVPPRHVGGSHEDSEGRQVCIMMMMMMMMMSLTMCCCRGGSCSMADGCFYNEDADSIQKIFTQNFLEHYTKSKAPFPLFFHAAWFFNRPHRKEGFLKFIDSILALPDVYFVTSQELIAWTRYPEPLPNVSADLLTSLSDWALVVVQVHSSPIFHCNFPNRPGRCGRKKNQCQLKHKGDVRQFASCQQKCPKRYPWVSNLNGDWESSLETSSDDQPHSDCHVLRLTNDHTYSVNYQQEQWW